MNQSLRPTPLILAILLAALPAGSLPAAAALMNQTTTLSDDAPDTPSQTNLVQPKFVMAIGDLPLMPGLSLIENNDVVFGDTNGRIVETQAVGAVDVDDVYKFYHRTLPQMGWKTVDWKRYQRENDLLRIDVHGDGKTTTVNFSIHPTASSGR